MHFELNLKIKMTQKIVFARTIKLKCNKKIRFFHNKNQIEMTIVG